MKIDWKHLATTPGYISLKAAYAKDASNTRHALRSKKELYKHFQWVINRAKHTSYVTGVPIDEVLNTWEQKRDYWWLNYYQDSRQKKTHTGLHKHMGIAGYRKYLKKSHWNGSKVLVKHRINDYIQAKQKELSTKKKKRWSMTKKKHQQSKLALLFKNL